MRLRDEKGQFIETTGETPYKRKQLNGINTTEQRVIWIKANGQIPNGFIIHHLNGNKKDNRLENLAMVSMTEHNKIHAHPAWNKGKKCPQISKAKLGHKVKQSQIKKTKETWKNKYLASMIEIHDLFLKGVKFEDIAKKLSLTRDQVAYRHSKYMRCYYNDLSKV